MTVKELIIKLMDYKLDETISIFVNDYEYTNFDLGGDLYLPSIEIETK